MRSNPVTSINTNQNALVALENLNATNASLTTTQNRISTGLKIASAKDNGAIWAIAETQKTQNSALDAVKDSLNNGKSVLDTTLSAGSQLTSILGQMQKAALAASDTGITDTSRAQYAASFQKLAQTYSNIVASATFNGVNQIDALTSSVSALGSANAGIKITSAHSALNVATVLTGMKAFTSTASTASGTADTVTATASAWTGATGAADAKADLDKISTALGTVTAAMSGFGVDSTAMDNQLTLVSNLQDSLTTGVGNLVDADVARESANLTALQTKQQLGVQSLSIANQAPQIILSLFKS